MLPKKGLYIVLFTFFGILVSMMFHGLIEIVVIFFLTRDFSRYGLGLTWDTWFIIHRAVALLLFTFGSFGGYWQGRHWWSVLYDSSGNRRRSSSPRK